MWFHLPSDIYLSIFNPPWVALPVATRDPGQIWLADAVLVAGCYGASYAMGEEAEEAPKVRPGTFFLCKADNSFFGRK